MKPRLVALAGLPAAGKSTLARALATATGWPILDKDRVRDSLFGDAVDYSDRQNDCAMAAVYEAARVLLEAGATPAVIIDGRTYTRTRQVRQLRRFAARHGLTLTIIQCVCSEATATERLTAQHDHPAADRDIDLWQRLAARRPACRPDLCLDTDATRPADLAARCLAMMNED